MKISEYIKNYSENIAGVVSLGGSSVLLLAGNTQSVVAASVFTVAELVLARTGHKTAGYSAGAALFAAGDLTLAFSESVQDGSALQISLLGMTAAWAAGALRYPFEQAAKATGSEKLQAVADALPVVCGTGNLALRLPGLFSAAHAGNYIVATAIGAWGVADALAGRLQERVSKIYKGIRDTQKETPGSDI